MKHLGVAGRRFGVLQISEIEPIGRAVGDKFDI